MSKFNILITGSIAALLLGGTALAADLQPAAAEAPFAQYVTGATSTLERAEVRAQAAKQQPVAGTFNAQAEAPRASDQSRAAVRQATRDAIKDGYRIPSGAQNS